MQQWIDDVRTRLARHHSSPDEDVVLELAQHAASAFEAARAEGQPEEEARARVSHLVDRWCRETAGRPRRLRRPPSVDPPAVTSRGMTGIGQDVRYGVRQLRRERGFALAALLVIALGIGATTTLFSLAYGVLMRPLPWPEADRIVRISEVREGSTRQIGSITTNATCLAWRDQPATIEDVAAYAEDSLTLAAGNDAERVRVLRATASLFPLLRARPHLGSVFTAADEIAIGNRPAVISHGLWIRRLGGRADVVGQPLELDGVRHTIVGVMREEFFFPTPGIAAWTPFHIRPVVTPNSEGRSVSLFRAIARLRPGVTPDQASAEATARSRTAPDLGMVGIAVFGTNGAATVSAVPYLASVTKDVRLALLVLLAAVGLLLLTAVANVAGMQLARAAARRREVAIRSALGAGTGRLARQLFTENLIIGVAGGLGGLLLSIWLHALLPSLVPADFPRLDDVAVDWRVAAFAMAAALFSTVVFGMAPALVATRLNLVETLSEDSLAPVGGRLRSRVGRMRACIMAGQMALAAVLLVGAVLLSRSFVALMNVDRGYEPGNLLTAELPLPNRFYTSERRAALLDVLLDRLRAVPAVSHAAAGNVIPLMPYDSVVGFKMPPVPGRPDSAISIHASVRIVSPDYFDALGLRVVLGRGFADTDTTSSTPVVLVNRTFARQYPDDHALGSRLPITFERDREGWQTIVGVVEDILRELMSDAAQPQIYVNYRQLPSGMETSTPVLLVRTTGDPSALASTLRALVREQDRSIALQSLITMEDRLQSSLARPRLYAVLLAGFALFAVMVSGVGLFGALSYSVTQRSREIGVRAALGARPVEIVALVLRQSLAITAAGVAIGLGVAALLSRHVGTLLYGITAHDVVSFAVVPLALMLVAAAACLAPARRAARVDPVKVLKGH